MSNLAYDCPLPIELPFIGSVDCSVKLDQINRLLLLRATAEIGAILTNEDAMKERATYEALLSGTGSNKGVITPLFAAGMIPPSEGNYSGGNDNSTIGGIPQYNGHDNVDFTGEFHSISQVIADQLRTLTPYSDASLGFVGMFALMFNNNGQVFFKKIDNIIKPIPLYNFVISDVGTEGLRTQSVNTLQMTLPAGWSQNLQGVKLDFDYKTLINVAPTPQP